MDWIKGGKRKGGKVCQSHVDLMPAVVVDPIFLSKSKVKKGLTRLFKGIETFLMHSHVKFHPLNNRLEGL